MVRRIVEQFVGVSGQVAAGMPLLLLTIALSRYSGLDEAGRFAVAVGVTAAVFSITNLGLRTFLVIDRLQQYSAFDYISVRGITLITAVVASALICERMGVEASSTAAILALRMSDTLADLSLGFMQATRSPWNAVRWFACHNLLRLVLAAGVFVVLSSAFDLTTAACVLVAASVALGTSIGYHLIFAPISFGERSRCVSQGSRGLYTLLLAALPFGVATIACSLISAFPRIGSGSLHVGADLGVVGAALSVSTLFGILLSSSWMRWFPTLQRQSIRSAAMCQFIIENSLYSIAMLILIFTVLPEALKDMFSFETSDQVDLARNVLACTVPFILTINLANIFKITFLPWGETSVYMSGLAAMGGYVLLFKESGSTTMMLLTASLAMFLPHAVVLWVTATSHSTAGIR